MNAMARFFGWLRRLFGGGKDDVADKINGHLETLRIRRLTYQDQRHELDERISKLERQRETSQRRLRELVDQDKHRGREARQLGQDLDTLKETIADLIARSGNRRASEDLLRRVVSAGEELMAFLPQQPDMAAELEQNLAELVARMGAEPAQALGRLLTFLETKLEDVGDVPVRHETDAQREDSESLREMVAEKDQRQRAEIEAEEVAVDVPQVELRLPAETEPSRPEEHD